MRAWEIITEDRDRAPEITLRSINRWSREEKEKQASHRRHAAFIRIMYSDPDRELKQIELERARLELEELRAEIAKTRAETEETKADTQKLSFKTRCLA